jgi:glycine oxidase
MRHPDICIAGAGIIGLSLALELHRRGASVTVLERHAALTHASIAAAGMLAVHDPENPSPLEPLSALSVALYPQFLARLEALSSQHVPFQTSRTFQSHHTYTTRDHVKLPVLTPGDHHFRLLEEHSIDPRQLAAALLAAVRNTSIRLLEHTTMHTAAESAHGIAIETSTGTLNTAQLIHTLGAWSVAPVTPRKGQMLTIALPPSLPLRDVIRTPDIYIVPRTAGPNAGRALIGATVEEAGFDLTTVPADLTRLRTAAAALLPALADTALCPAVDQWAGLRPATPDELPLLGRLPNTAHQFLATGHYRNGILLAPATAHVVAQLVEGEPTAIDLAPFTAKRFPQFENIAQTHRYSPIPS